MRSMQWQPGMLGTISAFAYRHRETKKNLCRGGRSQDLPNADFQPAVRHLSTKKQHKMDGIDITQTHLYQVKSFKFLGSIVNRNNSIEEEIKERISLGNKIFYANQDLFKSKRQTKILILCYRASQYKSNETPTCASVHHSISQMKHQLVLPCIIV